LLDEQFQSFDFLCCSSAIILIWHIRSLHFGTFIVHFLLKGWPSSSFFDDILQKVETLIQFETIVENDGS